LVNIAERLHLDAIVRSHVNAAKHGDDYRHKSRGG
jgi:hypothetical protein